MTFRGAIESVLRQYATFTGRASRPEYWWFYLFTVLLNMATGALDSVLGHSFVGTLVSLGLFLPTLAVTVRRLHDSDLSGWWLLLPFGSGGVGIIALIVALVAGLASLDTGAGAAGIAIGFAVVGVVTLLASVVSWLVLLLRPSSPGANRFGPNPHDSRGYAGTREPVSYGVDSPTGYGPVPGYGQPSAVTHGTVDDVKHTGSATDPDRG